MSISPCVGCSCAPSPALITPGLTSRASKCGAPAILCRIIITSTFIASMFLAVSLRVSPLTTLEVEEDMFAVSAESLFAASSNDIRVLVLGSKKSVIMVFPLRAGTFLIGRRLTSLKDSAVSRINSISRAVSSSSPKISFLFHSTDLCSGNDCCFIIPIRLF